MELENNELLINLFIKQKRLDKYLLFTNNNINKAIELYNFNLSISKSLYIPLSYFEIFLRNTCNDKLKKELGDYWFDNKKIMYGNNQKEDKRAINKINMVREEIILEKKDKVYIPTNSDIISNLQLGFWTNLFCSNYEFKLWNPYLRHLFGNLKRNKLHNLLTTIRKLRNRAFHYEPIIFDNELEQKYDNIINLIDIMSNKNITLNIERLSYFRTLYNKLRQ